MSRQIITVGVDPGLVHTGVVVLVFEPEYRRLRVEHAVVLGLDAQATYEAIADIIAPIPVEAVNIFIEQYRPRLSYNTDERMVVANKEFQSALQGELVPNTGVKKVVTRQLLEVFQCYTFGTRTHHDDLRSAARIALLGMLLDANLNRVLYGYLVDYEDGDTWE